MTAHACACCPLRFASNGELADHVRAEHSEPPHFERDALHVVRHHYPESILPPLGWRPRP